MTWTTGKVMVPFTEIESIRTGAELVLSGKEMTSVVLHNMKSE